MFYIVKSVNALVYFELFWSATTEHHGVSGDWGLHYIERNNKKNHLEMFACLFA